VARGAIAPIPIALALALGAPAPASGQGSAKPTSALHLDDVEFAGEQIRLWFRAVDELGGVAEIDAHQLIVRQDGRPIPGDRIQLSPAADLGQSIAVALVLDPALAGDGDTRAWVTTALEQLANALSDGDRVAIGCPCDPPPALSFGSAKEIAGVPWSETFAAFCEPDGAMHDAIYRALTALRDAPDLPRRQVVIAISAGPDRGSAHSVDDVIALARRKPEGIRPFTPIYAIARASAQGADAANTADLADLQRLSRGTDGDLFLFESPVHLPSLLVAAVRPLERSMVAIVRPELDGDAHELELAVGDLSASVKTTYPRGWQLLAKLGIALLPVLGLAWVAYVWLARRGRHGRLVFAHQPDRAISLRPGQLRIGALSQNDIVIDSTSASRRHAELRITADSVEIEDLDSENGTLVNDERIQVRALHPGDRIRIGDVELVYQK
jgi:hypothetical protein